MDLWNGLMATAGNCSGCRIWEDPDLPLPVPPLELRTVLIHEIGHCAFGIDHPDWVNGDDEPTSFTSSQNASTISPGSDGIRGTRDDLPSPLPGTRLIHWFRKADNDPFVVDPTIIDDSTYSRQIISLPPGSSWPASGSRPVGESLGYPDSQSVM